MLKAKKPCKVCRTPGYTTLCEQCRDKVPPVPETCSLYKEKQWRATREWFLSQPGHGYCEQCYLTGRVNTRQLEVHHMLKHNGNRELFYLDPLKHWSTLCSSCHAKATRRGE